MRYLKIDEQNWNDLFEGYLYNLGPKPDKEAARFYKELFHKVIQRVEESNADWEG